MTTATYTRLLKLSAHLLRCADDNHDLRMIDDGEGERWDVREVAERIDAALHVEAAEAERQVLKARLRHQQAERQ